MHVVNHTLTSGPDLACFRIVPELREIAESDLSFFGEKSILKRVGRFDWMLARLARQIADALRN